MPHCAPRRPRALQAPTIPAAFRVSASERPDAIAVRTQDGRVAWTWGELRERVDALAAGLAGIGVAPGDRVALLLSNRPEFQLADLAVATVGATPFSLYPTSTPAQLRHVLADAGARVLVAEQALLGPVLAARAGLPELATVVAVDGAPPEGCMALADVLAAGDPAFDPARAVDAIAPTDVLTLIYTSGTTGPPKGVQISHRNALANARIIHELVAPPAGARVISWLPAAHIAERNAHHYLPIVFGLEVTCCAKPREILACLPEVRPWWFFGVPRVWEKLKLSLEAAIAELEPTRRDATRSAIAAGVRRVRLEQRDEPVPAELEAELAAADAPLLAPLRARAGLDRAAKLNVGGAPIPVDVLEFFHAIGLPVAEIWGMSETCGGPCMNRPGHIRLGTVGQACPGVELRLADDGELLVRGEIVMLGYRNLPDATAEAVDADGWLHTGDVAHIDADGYVTIVDRKKEIIINAAGKNMSPAAIEATLKAASSLIGHAVVIGDGRPYNTALIALDADAVAGLARDEVRAILQRDIDAANTKLARVEQVRRFHVVPGEWTAGGDELTPTSKLKRKPIAEKYASEIAALYADA